MDANLHGTKVILPFCLKIKLPDKGGTASIYWVAVQKDLVSDNALALVLQDSVYTDKQFGECYQMVLKSYCGNKKRDFELEKEAFSGLQSNDQVPILRYLGSYTHDYGEGKDLGKTYNLLLEYGENDLFQAWADETNVPPVQAQEILRNWNSLFNVANAIRHVHDFEIHRGRNRPWRFRGWHADIKPDNILSVRGRLKLADFGFSSFAPVIDSHDSSEPTEFIRGFTDTYGAPEVFQMKQADGTLSGVSRSIDAWSFGCVLSVAATWIVLGFQGLRQYERLRQLSPANHKDGRIFDRFHDGFDVLPEVEKWHGYLRGNLRSSDTTTELVLDLIENKLLRTDPTARYNLDELCEKLQELSEFADHKITKLKKLSRDTDPVVMKALKKIEEEAQTQGSSEQKINLLQQPLLPVNPRERASMQINKEEMIRNKPLGQTTHRKQILEEKLENYDVVKMDDASLASGVHNGAITHSPTDATPSREPPSTSRMPKPRNPQRPGFDQTSSDVRHDIPNDTDHHKKFSHPATPPPSDPQHKFPGIGAGLYSDNAIPFNLGPRTDANQGKPNLRISTTVPPFPAQSAQSNVDLKSPFPTEENMTSTHEYNASPSSLYGSGKPNSTALPPALATPPPHTPEHDTTDHIRPSEIYFPTHQGYKGKGPMISNASPVGFRSGGERVDKPILRESDQVEPVANLGPPITVSQPEGTRFSEDQAWIRQSSGYTHEKQTVDSDHLSHPHAPPRLGNSTLLPLPSTVLDLPYEICSRRKKQDEQVPKGFAKGIARFQGSLGIETIARDTSLVDTFDNRREIVFVIDNGWTMSEHWPIVTFVAQTLAKNAAGLDKSGFDLKFTVDGHKHDEQRLKGDSGRRKLKKALKAAWPEYKGSDHVTTNMARVFAEIFKQWKRNNQPATTLFVLTDGVWSNTTPEDLEKTILDIAREDESHAGIRHFSIQFLRFGDKEAEKSRLQWLDDKFCDDHKLRDIIDHCSWRAKVDKMFKGSIEGYLDEQESEEEPIPYEYTKLVALFNTFNGGEDAMLSPTKDLFRAPSRTSHRSSTSSRSRYF